MKAAASGRPTAEPSAPPPRLKLTTAAAEAAANATGSKSRRSNSKSKKKTQNASKKPTAVPPTTAAAAYALMQRTPLEALQKSTTNEETKPNKPHGTSTALDTKKTMLRYQQMTSLGVQTVQLLCIPPTAAAAAKPKTQEKKQENSEEKLPLGTVQDQDGGTSNVETTTTTKPLASPRRQHAPPSALPVKSPSGKPNKKIIKQHLKGTFYGSAQPPAARHRIRTVDDESDSDLDSFIETDEEEEEESDSDVDGGGDGGVRDLEEQGQEEGQAAVGNDTHNTLNTNNNTSKDPLEQQRSDLYLSKRLNDKRNKPKKWKRALKEALNGYDAAKFADIDAMPDRRMHATYEDILAEEARAGKIAREIDRIEAEKEKAARAVERVKKRWQYVVLDDDDDDDSSDGNGDVLSDSSDEEDEDEDGENGVEKHVRKRRKKLRGLLASF